jgi:NADPH2:quinone reductase
VPAAALREVDFHGANLGQHRRWRSCSGWWYETHLMKAALFEAAGAPLRLTDLPAPEPGPGEVLVRIRASAVNPLDIKIHEGKGDHAQQPAPAVLGVDMAGVVEKLGAAVDRFQVGDEVYGLVGGVGGHQGTLAEQIAVHADLLARKPANLSFRDAAALPLVVITAWEGLVDRCAVASGERVLVLGAGGVGRVVVQLARALGAEVFAVDSEKKREGTGSVFLSRDVPLADHVHAHTGGRGFDVIYDTVDGATLDAAFSAVRSFGRVTSALGRGPHSLTPLSMRAASFSGVFTLLPLLTGEGRAHHGEILARAAQMAEAGRITALVDPRTFTLAQAEEAHQLVASGSARGKIVIDVPG